MALLLPLDSAALGRAADAVRDGFMAAYERDKDGVVVTLIETDDSVQQTLSGYKDAVGNQDLVVGPLSRSGVSAIAQSGAVRIPTIALNQVDTPAGADTMAPAALPSNLLMMGLSLDDEARQVANWAGAGQTDSRAFIVSANAAWQRRAAKAFGAQWQRLGLRAQSMELGVTGGFLSGDGLDQLKMRIQNEKPALLFVALDAEQTRQLREAVGQDVVMYGTSQLNPYALPDWNTAAPMPQLDQVRLLDLPWQLQADHGAVMAYPRSTLAADQRRSVDLERLYALGIDAYRVAREIAARHAHFEIDGVTGKLLVDFGAGATRFERIEQAAIYQDGVVVPVFAAESKGCARWAGWRASASFPASRRRSRLPSRSPARPAKMPHWHICCSTA